VELKRYSKQRIIIKEKEKESESHHPSIYEKRNLSIILSLLERREKSLASAAGSRLSEKERESGSDCSGKR